MHASFQVYVYCGIIISIILCHAISLHIRKSFNAFSLLNTFWAGFVIVTIKQAIEGYYSINLLLGDGAVEGVLVNSIVAECAIILGFELFRHSFVEKIIPSLPMKIHPNRLQILSILLICVGIYGYYLQFQSAGGFIRWIAVPRGGTDWENLGGYVAELANILPLGILFLVFRAALFPTSKIQIAFTIFLTLGMLCIFVYIGSRSRLITWTMSMLYVYYSSKDKNPSIKVTLLLFVLLIPATQFLAINRNAFRDLRFYSNEVNWSETFSILIPTFSDRGATDFDQYAVFDRAPDMLCIATIVSMYPSQIDYNHGYPLLEFITHGIPRSLWKEKRYPHYEAFTEVQKRGRLSDNWVTYGKVDVLTGPAFTFVGHWYSMYGLVSLIIAGILSGILYKSIDLWRYNSPNSQGRKIAYLVFLVIGFMDAAATPLFWLFSVPIQFFLLWFCLTVSRR